MQDIILQRLYEIKNAPGMWLGQKSLMYLFHYMRGYQCRQREIENTSDCLLPGFQEFIQDRYGVRSTRHWAAVIQFYEITDEAAFDRFYVLLEEFLSEKGEAWKK